MAAGVRRIVPVTLGWEDLPKSVSVEGASDDEYLREPVPGVLLQCDGGWLLLDTGFNTALITDPQLRRGAAGVARLVTGWPRWRVSGAGSVAGTVWEPPVR